MDSDEESDDESESEDEEEDDEGEDKDVGGAKKQQHHASTQQSSSSEFQSEDTHRKKSKTKNRFFKTLFIQMEFCHSNVRALIDHGTLFAPPKHHDTDSAAAGAHTQGKHTSLLVSVIFKNTYKH